MTYPYFLMICIMYLPLLLLLFVPILCYGGDELCKEYNTLNPKNPKCTKENTLSTGETTINGKVVGEVIQLKDGTTIRKYNGTTFICKDNNCQQRN